MQVIDCKAYRDYKLSQLKQEIDKLEIKPKLCVIQVGNNMASNKYVSNKVKRCEECGIKCKVVKLDENVSDNVVCSKVIIEQQSCDAIIVQEPLPKHINNKKVLNCISIKCDCDGLTGGSISKLYNKKECVIPATPQGIMDMLGYYNINMSGKNVLIIGRSNLVGRPLAELMLQKDATVTVAHSKTRNLQQLVSSGNYNMIVSCIGKAKYIKEAKADYLIDVGINFDDNGKMCGDFDIDSCDCKYYTSVPKGVGLLTQATIVSNVLKCYKLQH